MSKTIVAVIGCGRIAQNAHFPAFAQIPDLYVKYACDLIEEKAQAMKDKYPDLVGEVITDYKVALADPEVEAVFVLTPNFAHYTVSMDALRAGKHVMCEKPITTGYALSCEMAEEAKKQGKIMNIGVCNRYQSSVERPKFNTLQVPKSCASLSASSTALPTPPRKQPSSKVTIFLYFSA